MYKFSLLARRASSRVGAWLIAFAIAAPAGAATVEFNLDLGTVDAAANVSVVDAAGNTVNFQDFIGTDLTLNVSIEGTTQDSRNSNQRARFRDLSGTLTLTNGSTTLELFRGVRIEVDSRGPLDTISFASNSRNPNNANPVVLDRTAPISIGLAPGFFTGLEGVSSDVETILAQLSNYQADQVALDTLASILVNDGGTDVVALELDPVPIPLPTPVLLLGGAVAMLTYGQRRRKFRLRAKMDNGLV